MIVSGSNMLSILLGSPVLHEYRDMLLLAPFIETPILSNMQTQKVADTPLFPLVDSATHPRVLSIISHLFRRDHHHRHHSLARDCTFTAPSSRAQTCFAPVTSHF